MAASRLPPREPFAFDGHDYGGKTLDAPALAIYAVRATVYVLPWQADVDGDAYAGYIEYGIGDREDVALDSTTIANLCQLYSVRECRVLDTPAWASPDVAAESV